MKTFRTSTTSPGYVIGLTATSVTSGFWRVYYYTGNDYGSPAYSETDLWKWTDKCEPSPPLTRRRH